MKGLARLLTLALGLITIFSAVSCGGSAQTVTKEQEVQYRNPPKEPPAEYKPNQIGQPPAPPANNEKK